MLMHHAVVQCKGYIMSKVSSMVFKDPSEIYDEAYCHVIWWYNFCQMWRDICVVTSKNVIWILTPRQNEIVMDALSIYTSDRNDAPHGEIAELRERFVKYKP